jgi:hypothetical protein
MIASRKGQNVSLFLKNGEVDVNIQDEEGDVTALVLASKYGYPEVVEELIYHPDLNLSLLMHSGQTQLEDALLYAYKKCSIEIISILEEEG